MRVVGARDGEVEVGVMLLMCEMLATGLDEEGRGCSGVDVRLRLLFLSWSNVSCVPRCHMHALSIAITVGDGRRDALCIAYM